MASASSSCLWACLCVRRCCVFCACLIHLWLGFFGSPDVRFDVLQRAGRTCRRVKSGALNLDRSSPGLRYAREAKTSHFWQKLLLQVGDILAPELPLPLLLLCKAWGSLSTYGTLTQLCLQVVELLQLSKAHGLGRVRLLEQVVVALPTPCGIADLDFGVAR